MDPNSGNEYPIRPSIYSSLAAIPGTHHSVVPTPGPGQTLFYPTVNDPPSEEPPSEDPPPEESPSHTFVKRFNRTKKRAGPPEDENDNESDSEPDESSKYEDEESSQAWLQAPKGSAYVDQLPMNCIEVKRVQLAPRDRKWRPWLRRRHYDTMSDGVFRRIYCIHIPDPCRNSRIITWPEEKQHLRGVNWAVTLNCDIADACLKAGWEVLSSGIRNQNIEETLSEWYGQPGVPITTSASYLGGHWVADEKIYSPEVLVRWLILQDVWNHLPKNIQDFVNTFSRSNTLKIGAPTNQPTPMNQPTSTNQPTPTNQPAPANQPRTYWIADINIIHEQDEEVKGTTKR